MRDKNYKFIQDAIKKPGSLRKSLKVKKGQNIPEEKLEKASHSKNPITKKRAILAKTLKKISRNKWGAHGYVRDTF